MSTSVSDLIAFAKLQHLAVRDGGLQVNVGTTAAPVVVDVASDADGRSLVSGCIQMIGLAAQLGQSAPSWDWVNDDFSQQQITAAEMYAIGQALYTFVQSTYAALSSVIAAINAGSLTTFAAIGNPSNWPVAAPAASASAITS